MHPTLRIREARAGDRDLLAQWAAAMAWETEHKQLDPDTISTGIEAGIKDPVKARPDYPSVASSDTPRVHAATF